MRERLFKSCHILPVLGEIFISWGKCFQPSPHNAVGARVKHSSSLYLLVIVTDRLGFYYSFNTPRRGGHIRQHYVVAGAFQLISAFIQIAPQAGKFRLNPAKNKKLTPTTIAQPRRAGFSLAAFTQNMCGKACTIPRCWGSRLCSSQTCRI